MLAKDGYKPAINGTVTMKAEKDAEGNLITNAETTPAGTKTLRFTKANADNGASQNEAFLATIFSFTNTPYLGSSNQFNVTWKVE